MITSFGKILRKIRIDRNEILLDMAKKLEVAVSYLSAVETNRRAIPESWLATIPKLYHLNEDETQKLYAAALESIKNFKIRIEHESPLGKDVVAAFARQLPEMNEEEKEQLYEFLRKFREKK
ncbi:MAG: helix-turn-helix transcriptional regulator [Planctomycetia bacterium]|nr:helix-turn-helix transcriptional regulator [Planctomycetia bacterium]